MAKLLIANRWMRMWFDKKNWQLGFSLFWGSEGVGFNIGLGPLDITFRKDY